MATVQFGADHERLDRQIRTIDRDPYPPWCNFRFVGIEPLELADHLTVARRWGKDFKAFCSRRRFRRANESASHTFRRRRDCGRVKALGSSARGRVDRTNRPK